ncbi:MAG: succinylglutamate desuccinylase/aspartoacylase family protein [Pseudomonadales bacterium]|nr:succinylglutamate desuccinylase/aspartoacylase family protein [Pseudomonadales bacterium]
MHQGSSTEMEQFRYWKNPDPDDLGENVYEFLDSLTGPTHIHLSGQDSSRCRFATTLLHGNEPSGLHAVFTLLKRQITPAIDIHILIPSVDAAKQAPGFIYRMLPHQKDLNRCFQPPYGDSEQDLLAKEILHKLDSYHPECVIDIHNTSGSSPSFGVTTFMDAKHDALVSLFTHRMIVTDIKLGALMEISENLVPTVTIECGGAQDRESHLLATEGLERYMTQEEVLTIGHTDMSLEFFHNPLRLELKEGSEIAYGDHCLMDDGVTLLPDIENHNFGYVDKPDRLGFVSGNLDDTLAVKNPLGEQKASQFFELRDGALYPMDRLKLFMVTTNPEIARKDCLFYLVRPN